MRSVLAIVVATVWIGASEFVRNQLLFLGLWTDHYRSLGLEFPGSAVNGVVWVIWSLALAAGVFAVSRRFGFWWTVGICWWTAFVMMWLAVGNLGVLPLGLLWFAVPLSILEVVVAAWIVRALAPAASPRP